MRPSTVQTRPVLWVLLLALGLRLSLFFVIAPHPDRFYSAVDSHDYVQLATHLHEGYDGPSGLLFESGLFRPPAYPLVIAAAFSATGDAPWVIILLQIAVGVITVWLTYRLALRLVGPRTAVVAALVLAVDPISIILTNYLLPETLFTFLLVAGTLLWLKALDRDSPRLNAGAGALLGTGVLFRSVGLYLPVVLLPVGWVLHKGRGIRRLIFSIVFLLTFAIPVGGWIARNAAVTGVPLFSTGEGINLLYFRSAAVLAQDEGLSLEEEQGWIKLSVRSRVQPEMNPAEVSHLERSLALEIMFDRPVAALVTLVKSTSLMMTGPGRAELLHLLGDSTPTQISGPVQISLIAVEIAIYAVIVIGAVLGSYLLLRRRKHLAALLPLSIIVYFILASLATTPNSRYRVPIMPFIAVLAGYAAKDWRRVRSRGHRTIEEPEPGPLQTGGSTSE